MSDDVIAQVLNLTRRIAVVGASNKPARPSYGVMQFLIAQGYDVTPVNPGLAGG
jgi:predicted CoA-binding protein